MFTLKELIKNRKDFTESFFAEVSDKRWGYNAKDDGWSDVIDFIEERKER